VANCSRCVFVGWGEICPNCKEVSEPQAQSYLSTQEHLYGSAAQGRYFEGLGTTVYGKADLDKKLAAKGLRQKEGGEKFARPREQAKLERRKEFKKAFDKNVGGF